MQQVEEPLAQVARELAPRKSYPWAGISDGFKARRGTIITILVIFAFTLAIAFLFKPFQQPEQGDPSIYDYIAQSILRGHLPYRDAIDPKGPGSMYLSAAALIAGRFLRIPDIFAIRLLYILFWGSLSVATYLVAKAFLTDYLAALLAAFIPIFPLRFSEMMIVGTQPKLPMILFGLLALLAICKDRPFLAGLTSMLSCLCWQPGLMFAGVAFLYFSRYFTSWKDKRALKVVLGSAIPLLITLLYFYLRGGLSSFVTWTFVYDYSVYMPTDQKPVAMALDHYWKVVQHIFGKEVAVFYVSAAGLAWYILRRLWTIIRQRSALAGNYLFSDAVAMPPVVYFAFCMINMQSGADLIPFLPFFGIFGAFLVLDVSRGVGWAVKSRPAINTMRTERAILMLVLLCVVFYTIKFARKYRVEPPTLAQQYRDLASVKAYLNPGDKIYAHGSTEILVFLHMQNLNSYVSFDTSADDYIGARTAGGFPGVVAQMEAEAPKVVVMTRLARVNHRKELEDWMRERYDQISVPTLMAVYVRKPYAEVSPLNP